jgi:lipopolysaccharide biosynthesis protein
LQCLPVFIRRTSPVPLARRSIYMIKNKIIAHKLLPSYGLSERIVDGEALIFADHEDPQFILKNLGNDENLVLGKGIYTAEFTGTTASGQLNCPCLYLDKGQGFSEDSDSKIVLSYAARNTWRTAFHLNAPIRAFRFDPSVEPFIGRDINLKITKISSARSAAFNVARWLYRSVVSEKFRQRAASTGLARQLVEIVLQQEPTDISSISSSASVGIDYSAGPVAALIDDYTARTFSARGGRGASFAAVTSVAATQNEPAFKPIAYYLPQMHPFAENDAWWGRGFTEWTNVSKAVAQFGGHYQPKIPGELGFYDLRLPEVMARQIELATLYGLHGFCFYYYWFDGKRLLDKPLDMFLQHSKDPAFNFPFCLCWANENWTRRWDGAEHEVLMAQNHSKNDHVAVFNDLFKYLKDPRYIRVDGKPVIVIYRPTIIPDVDAMLAIWRGLAKKRGLPGLYLVCTNSFGFSDPAQHGFDAICGFPPHGLEVNLITNQLTKINNEFSGHVFAYEEVVHKERNRLTKLALEIGTGTASSFPGIMTAWDNEARKPNKGNVFHDSTPGLYREWLDAAARATIATNAPDRRFVFINAWNEWAEGAYLEPDRRFGYAYLAATADVVREHSAQRDALAVIANKQNKAARKADCAVCLHIFYPEMIDEFADIITRARKTLKMDAIVTIPDIWLPEDAARLVKTLKPVRLLPVANRGRDVLPFFTALREGLALGYTAGCKIHSKKSPQLVTGDDWRHRLTNGLLSREALSSIKNTFIDDPELAIAAPASEFMSASDHFAVRDNLAMINGILEKAGVQSPNVDEFVAGTMFWFKFKALEVFTSLGYSAVEFGPELGQIDGTLAHAFERVFVPYVKGSGYRVLKYPGAAPDDMSGQI